MNGATTPNSLLSVDLSPDDLHAQFDSIPERALKHAVKHSSIRVVEEVAAGRTSIQVRAVVSLRQAAPGSHPELRLYHEQSACVGEHQTQAILWTQGRALWPVETSCSCPVGASCIHGFALAMRMCNGVTQARSSIQQIDSWLNDAGRAYLPPKAASQKEAQRLGLCLDHYRPPGRTFARPAAQLALIADSEGRPGIRRLKSMPTHADLVEGDREAYKAFARHAGYMSGVIDLEACLARPFTRWLFDEMLAAGRVRVDEQPLRAGPAIPLDWHWIEDAAGSLELRPFVGDQKAALLNLDPVYCIHGAMFAPVQGGMEAISRYCGAPVIPAEARRIVADRLRVLAKRRSPWAWLPMPADEAVEASPVPAVVLKKDMDSQTIDCEFTVQYGDTQCPIHGGDDHVPLIMRGKRHMVRRDRAREAEALKRILGVVPHAGYQASPRHKGSMGALARIVEDVMAGGGAIINDASLVIDGVATATIIAPAVTESADKGWFDFGLELQLGDERVLASDLVAAALHARSRQRTAEATDDAQAMTIIEVQGGRIVRIPSKTLLELIAPAIEWAEESAPLRLHKVQAAAIAHETGATTPAELAGVTQAIERLALIMSTQAAVDEYRAPVGFRGELRQYQRQGVLWLDTLAEAGLGGLLGDDMGLGKTVQILAHLAGCKERGQLDQPALCLLPTSLIHNWMDEARRFTPRLRVLNYTGSKGERKDKRTEVADHDIVVTTYQTFLRDAPQLAKHHWAVVVADEAQAIKNPRSKIRTAVRQLNSDRVLAVTGTPIENRLLDLWSQMDLAVHGLLSDEKTFKRLVATPIETHADNQKRARLVRNIAPFILRRRKKDVVTELPPKTETVMQLDMSPKQRVLYESIRAVQAERVKNEIACRGLRSAGIIVLDALLKLRQVCCDPSLVNLRAAEDVDESVKRATLLEMVQEMVDQGRQVLIYSTFVMMLRTIEQDLQAAGIEYAMLHGGTTDRAGQIKRFQSGAASVFLLSLKAGGTGLNLTEADSVIIYDPWWNPQAENQATDRAHRIGQNKPVFVYRLLCANTVESRIQEMQAKKSALATSVLDDEGGSAVVSTLTVDEINSLFE